MGGETNINKIEKMKTHKALIDYVDSNESSTTQYVWIMKILIKRSILTWA